MVIHSWGHHTNRSSMSFLHLMQWHAEWMQKLSQWEREEAEGDHLTTRNRTARRRKCIPFIVVANKIDLLEEESEKLQKMQPPVGQNCRSVLGLRGGEYEGKELKYEYAADTTNQNVPNQNASPPTTQEETNNSSPNKRLTYSLKETLWSTDASYLNALQLTEDQLPANRQMILLWCQRYGIPHVEASALTGQGVEEAMNQLITIGVEELRLREKEKIECIRDQEMLDAERQKAVTSQESLATHNGTNANTSDTAGAISAVPSVDPSQYYFVYKPRQDQNLDLFARYDKKDEQRCSPFRCWLSLFSYCKR